jgi:hypothetical membrane protein
MLAGFLTPIIAFSSIGLAILTHPWFSLQNNAISDLGRIGLEKNYILNFGFILAGFTGLIFAFGFITQQKRFLGKVGGYIFCFGVFSLLLIGVFPEGTPQHLPVSLGFFLLSSLGMLLKGIDELKKSKFGTFTIILICSAWTLAIVALKTFRGVAIPELLGAIAVSVWVYVYIGTRIRISGD